MTRISNIEHYRRYRLLHALHERGNATVALVAATKQWVLHDYYAFTKTMTPAQLMAHIAAVSAERQSLPNRAGKTFRQIVLKYELLARYVASQEGKPRIPKNAEKRLYVFGEVMPEVSAERMAQIVADLSDTNGLH